MPGSGVVPAGRYIVGATFAAYGLINAWVPGAAASPAWNDLRRIGGTTFWFTALAAFAVAQLVTWRLQQLHWHAGALVAEAAVLVVLAVMLCLAATRLHAQGLAGAALLTGLAVHHLVYAHHAVKQAAA